MDIKTKNTQGYEHTHTHTHTDPHPHTHTHRPTHTHTPTHKHTHTHRPTHTHTHTDTQTQSDIYVHMHTPHTKMQSPPSACESQLVRHPCLVSSLGSSTLYTRHRCCSSYYLQVRSSLNRSCLSERRDGPYLLWHHCESCLMMTVSVTPNITTQCWCFLSNLEQAQLF